MNDDINLDQFKRIEFASKIQLMYRSTANSIFTITIHIMSGLLKNITGALHQKNANIL